MVSTAKPPVDVAFESATQVPVVEDEHKIISLSNSMKQRHPVMVALDEGVP